MFKLLKESWLSLTLILVILATVCTATFAWQVDQKQMPLTATSALVNVKLNLANNEESDPGVFKLDSFAGWPDGLYPGLKCRMFPTFKRK